MSHASKFRTLHTEFLLSLKTSTSHIVGQWGEGEVFKESVKSNQVFYWN